MGDVKSTGLLAAVTIKRVVDTLPGPVMKPEIQIEVNCAAGRRVLTTLYCNHRMQKQPAPRDPNLIA
jgi:hypothetical protein